MLSELKLTSDSININATYQTLNSENKHIEELSNLRISPSIISPKNTVSSDFEIDISRVSDKRATKRAGIPVVYTVSELRRIATQLGIKKTGVKKDLVDRILSAYNVH